MTTAIRIATARHWGAHRFAGWPRARRAAAHRRERSSMSLIPHAARSAWSVASTVGKYRPSAGVCPQWVPKFDLAGRGRPARPGCSIST